MSAATLSVIVPTLDEERRIGPQLERLVREPGVDEIVVVDGGSTDATRTVVAAWPGVRLLLAERGRARQMNAGARAAAGELLLFLHADTLLPEGGVAALRHALQAPAVVAAAFRTWTVVDDPTAPRAWLGPLLHLADLRSRYSGLPYGDQGLCLRAADFAALGGFADLPLMEDLELSQRLRRRGRIRTLPASVQVSGRRFLARPLFYTVVMNVFPLLYRAGVSPARLARLYAAVR